MRVVIEFSDAYARSITAFLRRRYNSKAELPRLAKRAVLKEVVAQAEKELREAQP